MNNQAAIVKLSVILQYADISITVLEYFKDCDGRLREVIRKHDF